MPTVTRLHCLFIACFVQWNYLARLFVLSKILHLILMLKKYEKKIEYEAVDVSSLSNVAIPKVYLVIPNWRRLNNSSNNNNNNRQNPQNNHDQICSIQNLTCLYLGPDICKKSYLLTLIGIRREAECLWRTSRCLEIDETLCWVLWTSSQSKLKPCTKRTDKIVKFYAH